MNPDQKDNYWQAEPEETLGAHSNDASAPQIETSPTNSETVEYPPVAWEAHEYIVLDKSGLWYTIFGLLVVGFVVLDILFFHIWTLSLLVIVIAIAIIVYSRRPARVIQYTLSIKQGLYIGERLYNFDDFKAFGLIRDGEHHSIMLIPTKRFAPGVSVYFPEEAGEKIVDILGSRLPMENLKLDVIDVIVRRLRL
jgi:hypothetical protein